MLLLCKKGPGRTRERAKKQSGKTGESWKEFDNDGHSRVVQKPETQEEITNNSLQWLDDTHLGSKSLYFYCHQQHTPEIDQRLTRSKKRRIHLVASLSHFPLSSNFLRTEGWWHTLAASNSLPFMSPVQLVRWTDINMFCLNKFVFKKKRGKKCTRWMPKAERSNI